MDHLNLIRELYQKYLDNSISAAEKTVLFNFFKTSTEAEISEVVGEFLNNDAVPADLDYLQEHTLKLFEVIKARTTDTDKDTGYQRRKLIAYLIPIAAAIAFIIGGLYFFNLAPKPNNEISFANSGDIAPGKLGATLTLANGQKINLNKATTGEIARQSGIVITKSADGQLIYHISNVAAADNEENTLTTTKGETYVLILPDKSKVWMNAASSLTYFASLNQNGVRKVKLDGEAYFQIAKDKLHPFIVETPSQQVKVLGTHFNVNSYRDESSTKTTLLEGSVEVANIDGDILAMLIPNQQAQFDGKMFSVKTVNVDNVVAWKDGKFAFKNEELQTIMRKVERWYNVEVIFKDQQILKRTFSGKVSRFDNVSKVLKILERTGEVKFKIEGRTITAF